jgi:hypothetical protein
MTDLVGIDSNALTYLIDAMRPGYDPASDASGLAQERIAMIRVFLYGARALYLTPTVATEYEAIRSDEKRAAHARAACILLVEGSWQLDDEAVVRRASELRRHHDRPGDCRIVAESELTGLTHCLTCDGDLIDRLGAVATVKIERPTEYWARLGVKPGARPIWSPCGSNPLSAVSWWRL